MEKDKEKIDEALTEQKAEDFMPKKEKPRLKMSRYTVMLVPDSTDDAKTYEFTIDKIARYTVVALALIIIIVALIVSFAVKNYRLRNDSSMQAIIDNMEVTMKELEEENGQLKEVARISDEKVNELNERVNELEIETAGLYIPDIYPYKGSAIQVSDLVVKDAISYSCLMGVSIVATANGTVESITDDMYGYTVLIDHKNGYKTQYTMEEIPMVAVGDAVVRGEVLAYVKEDDETLSYAVIVDGKNQNPKDFLGGK